MILVVCTIDSRLMYLANMMSSSYPAIFGDVYQIYNDELPKLAVDENLFILSHGSSLHDGVSVIGDTMEAFNVNGFELYREIKSIFPDGYHASIYIDACYTADSIPEQIGFAETFYVYLQDKHTGVPVFGRVGQVSGPIPFPQQVDQWKNANPEKKEIRVEILN